MLSKTAAKTFNLLGLGQRGVGKTVFLAGSYAELHAGSQTGYSQHLWLTCQDTQAQENIENILAYVARTGQYPPPTMKITNFDFSLKCHNWWGSQTLCHLHWWDIPGEICDIRNLDFRSLVPTSHGCCVFIDAYALVHRSSEYSLALQEVIQQVMAIATIVSLKHIEYAFALILTKCDLLNSSDSMSQAHLEERLQPLTGHLDTMKVNYQTFYLNVPIVNTKGTSILKATDAAAPFLWLVWELSKTHNINLLDSSLKVVPSLLSSSFQLRKEPTNGLTPIQKPTGDVSRVKKIPPIRVRWRLLSSTYKFILIVAIAGAVAVISLLLMNYKLTNQFLPTQQEETQ